MKAEALRLLARGLSVVPIAAGAKMPPEGCEWTPSQEAPASAETIGGWYEIHPGAGVGAITGPVSRLLVLDVDGEVGLLSIKDRPIPVTPTARTPRGGLHFMFRWNEALAQHVTTFTGLFPGVDIRGAGGLVVLPPSRGASGSSYSWIPGRDIKTCPLAEVPAWLLDAIAAREKKKAERYKGARHPEFIRVACGYFRQGLPASEIKELMREWNTNELADPFPEARFEKEWAGIEKYWSRGIYMNQDTKRFLEGNSSPGSQPSSSPTVHPQGASLVSVSLGDFLAQGDSKIDWIVEGFIPKGGFVFLGGFAKVGKSWVMMDLATEVARGGGSWMGLLPCAGGRVLYIDQENPQQLIRVRYSRILKAKGLVAPPALSLVSVRGLNICSEQGFHQLSGLIEQTKPTLILGDAFIRFHDAQENDATSMAQVGLRFAKLIEKYGVTFLFADHETFRGTGTDGQAPTGPGKLRGTGEKHAFADMVFSLTKGSASTLKLHHAFSRWAVEQDPVYVSIEDTAIDATMVKGSR